LLKRVRQREAGSRPSTSDAGPGMLEAKLVNRDPLTEKERERTVVVRMEEDPSGKGLARCVREQLEGPEPFS